MRQWQLLLQLDPAPGQASYRKIVDGLAQAIRSGRLAPGAALPGTRELATLLDVNRKTVVLAYDEAIAKGWLVSQARRGTFVSTLLAPAPLPASDAGRAVSAPAAFAPAFMTPSLPPYFSNPPLLNTSNPTSKHQQEAMTIDNGAPDHRLLPQTVLHRYYRHAMQSTFKADWVRYGSTEPAAQLRSALVQMLRSNRGLNITAANICLTQGTQMALQLAAAALIRPGDVVLVERLSYPPAWAIFRALGAHIEVVNLDQHGCQTEHLERLCQQHSVRLIYVTPHHQFPTTVSMPAERRQKLLALATRYQFTIIEEDYDHEYHFEGRPYLPLASDQAQRNVIYVGSLSKLLGSSFRCGFVVAPVNLIEALGKRLLLTYPQGDAVMYKMLAELIKDGELGKHLRRAARHYRMRKDTLLECLHQTFGDRISVRAPQGGLALWVQFTAGIDVGALVQRAAAQRLFVRHGRQFSPLDQAENALRLGFASLTPEQLTTVVQRLQLAAGS